MDNINNQKLSPPSQELRRASKKEQYLRRREQKEKERLRRLRQARYRRIRKMGSIFLLVIITGLVIFGLANYFSKADQGTNSGGPKIEINPQRYDAGTVSMAEGLVKYTYEIKNNGEGDLKIDRIWTSCMCTTARLKVGDKESEEFGMHSNPIFWSQEIAPGEIGFLEVTFDPGHHGSQGTGSVVRAVYLSTNDPESKEVEVKLTANVIP